MLHVVYLMNPSQTNSYDARKNIQVS